MKKRICELKKFFREAWEVSLVVIVILLIIGAIGLALGFFYGTIIGVVLFIAKGIWMLW